MPMRFTNLLALGVFTSLFANAKELANDSFVSDVEPYSEPVNTINLNISYAILEKPDADLFSFLEFEAEETMTLNYMLLNNENAEVTIFGVSGNVYDASTMAMVANVSDADITPVIAGVNETIFFQQEVKLVLPEGRYFLEPVIRVTREEEPMKVAVRPMLVEIVPPLMSFFNPQFLSVQLTLIALVGGVIYYFTNMAPKKTVNKRQKAEKTKIDQSWLPETYKK